MEIKTKLTERDFINVNFVLLYKKIAIKILMGLMTFALLYTIYFSVTYDKPFSLSTIIWPVVFLVVLPLMTFIAAKRNFNTNARIKEAIEYQFGKEFLHVKGESFSSQLTWDKIYKVTMTKNWLLIWQNRQIANVIPRRDVWEGDVTTLKEILNSHHVKNNL